MAEIIKNAQLVADDAWTLMTYPPLVPADDKPVSAKLTGASVADEATIQALEIPPGKVIVPLAVWLARQPSLETRMTTGELGVWLDACELVELLVESVDDINAFSVIALNFPKFGDGRAYSSATLLRTRYGYRNELRAVGDVLRDYFYFMKRSGFDVIVPLEGRYGHDQLQEALNAMDSFSEAYQGAADEQEPLWRRQVRVATP